MKGKDKQEVAVKVSKIKNPSNDFEKLRIVFQFPPYKLDKE